MANVVNNNTATRRGNQTDRVDFICKVRYGNTLPDLPFEPKFLEAPFVSLNRFIEYKPTSLEKSYKYELLTEPDLNVKIDLIDPMTYFFDPNQRTSMHIKDEKLLEDESVSQQNSKRSLQHSKIVPWMRKTEYISTEFNRYGVGAERQESKVGYGIKKKFGVEHISYKNRESQITAINRTFEEMKKPIKKHYSKPGVYAVDEIPILPDFDMWVIPFAQVIFDADPLPLYKGDRKNKLSHAILRGMMDSDNNQFVGYFPPSDSALEQQLLDDQHVTKDTVEVDKNGTYKEDFEYEHLLEREYNWTVKNKATVGYEQENYFFVFRGKSLFYNELESRVRLTRRLKSSNAKNSSLVIKYRPPSAKELKTMENRLKKLLYPFETLEEEEEGEDEEEEEESVSSEKEDNDNNSEKSEKNVQTKSQTADSSAEEESSSSEHDNEQEKNAVVSSDDDDDEDESADDNENQQLSNVQSQEKSDDDDDSSVEEEKTKKDESSTSSSSSSEDDDDDDD